MGDEADHSAIVAEFSALAGVEPHVAEHYLAAHDWQIEGALNLYFADQDHPPPAPAAYDEPEGEALDFPQPMHQAGDGDDELRRALAASLGGQGAAEAAAAPPTAHPVAIEIPSDDEAEGEGLEDLAQQRASALAAHRAALQHREGMMDMAGQVFQQAGMPGPSRMLGVAGTALLPLPRPAGLGGARLGGRSIDMEGEGPPGLDEEGHLDEEGYAAAYATAMNGGHGAAGPSHQAGDPYGGAGGSGGVHGDDIELPEGIDAEEARMLEAAMLGIPYQGRIPDFSNRPPPAPVDPETAHQRLLRDEQDAAYEESLLLDRMKQEAAERQRQEEEEARLAVEAAAAQQLQDEQEAERQLATQLERKAARLPAEPASGEAGSIQVVVRMPDGSRKGRRFRTSDPLHAAFDFVDLESGGRVLRPGSYRLVTQFPRKVYQEEQEGSFEGAGITADTAFFVESSA